MDCQCNAFGSISKSCDQIDGKCNCKTGYEGIKCGECAPELLTSDEVGIDRKTQNNGSHCSGKNYKTFIF